MCARLAPLAFDTNELSTSSVLLSGQERFGNMTRVYYKEAAAAIVVFDSTRAATFEGALRWKADLDQKVRLADGSPIPAILLANKCDLDESTISEVDLNKCCEENGFIGAYRTSAKENIGIDEAASLLAGHVLTIKRSGQYEIPLIQQDGDVRRLTNGTSNGTKRRRANSITTKQSCCG
uniref:Uncharacterized protein n=1 Tax=Plectus sambesii TaxID=2011161 RepID=A0A914XHV6_9BILA